jgi:hypothetical protein
MSRGQRIALTFVALGAVVGIIFGFSLGKTGTAKPKLPPPFVRIYPPPGDFDLRQVQPSVDVSSGYTADLQIDGREVVEDDIVRVEPLHRVTYSPKPDSVIGKLGPGRHCVTAAARGETEHQYDGVMYRWCFTLH